MRKIPGQKYGNTDALSSGFRKRKRAEGRSRPDQKLLCNRHFRAFETLEDLELFPNLEELHLTYDTGSMTDEEKEEFQKYRGGITNMLEETLPQLKKLRKLSLTYFDYFEDLDFLSECRQIEELDINYNIIKNIRG